MFIVVKHQVSNPTKFVEAGMAALSNLPAGVKAHSFLPNSDSSYAVCLWEADTIDAVKNILEPATGKVSNNEYYQVDSKIAMGLPSAVKQAP
jgi:hypothetical protein